MSENFAELFAASLSCRQMRPGDIVKGTIVNIDNDFVTVNVGLKSEAIINKEQFSEGELEVDGEVDVAIEVVDDGFGETILSREKAKRVEAWKRLEQAHENGENIVGFISGKVKGGFTVEIDSIRAFLPGSLVDIRPVRDMSYLEGKDIELKVIKMDQRRNNVVVSRRSVLESENGIERESLIANLVEGQEIKGIVKNLTDYGAFIDLGGIDGLLHITDISWKRVKHPSEVISVGDEISVKVLKIDEDKKRVSLGLKQMGDDPWGDLARRFPINSRLFGRVTNLTDYGCFVEIEDGIEGLVHVSEMDWTNKNIHPSKVVKMGDEIEVQVLEIDEDRRRISLGIKQCRSNPWEAFADNHKAGERLTGKIKSITDFGIFIGLEGNIDGLVHLSDISWSTPGEEAIRNFRKGQELETTILGVDAARERISLGIKQLENDPFATFVASNNKGSVIKGVIATIENRGLRIDLGGELFGYIRASEVSSDKTTDLSEHFAVGDEVEAKCIGVDKKNRTVNLSIKAMHSDSGSNYQQENQQRAPSTTLGDLFKEKMSDK